MAKKKAEAVSGDCEMFEQDGRYGIRRVADGHVLVRPKHESHYDAVLDQCNALNERAARGAAE